MSFWPHPMIDIIHERLNLMLPWVPETFHAWFPISVKSLRRSVSPEASPTGEKKALVPRVTWCPCKRALHHFTSWPAVIDSSVITDHYLHSFIIWCWHQLAGILWKGDTVYPTRMTSARTQAGFTDSIPQLAEKPKQTRNSALLTGHPGLTWSQHHKKLANTVQRLGRFRTLSVYCV